MFKPVILNVFCAETLNLTPKALAIRPYILTPNALIRPYNLTPDALALKPQNPTCRWRLVGGVRRRVGPALRPAADRG